MKKEKEIQEMQERVIREFNSDLTQEVYIKHAEEGLWESERELIRRYFNVPGKILDIGCGTGRTTLALHDIGYEVVGADITPNMVENAKRIARSKSKSIRYEVGDAANLQFDDNEFDYALFSNQGWSQIPTKARRAVALSEIYRILKPGGVFIFTVHPRMWYSKWFLLWILEWLKFYVLKPIGIPISALEFGDRFFKRERDGLKYNQKQYIHIPLVSTVKEMLKEVGFELVWSGRLKSPYFFVCKK